MIFGEDCNFLHLGPNKGSMKEGMKMQLRGRGWSMINLYFEPLS